MVDSDEEVGRWIGKGRNDLNAAENSLKSGDYGWASFQVQQAVEKALKGLLIKKTGRFPKTHDLVRLSELVDAPNEIIVDCGKISPLYIEARYPDFPENYSESDARSFIEMGRDVLKWIEENL